MSGFKQQGHIIDTFAINGPEWGAIPNLIKNFSVSESLPTSFAALPLKWHHLLVVLAVLGIRSECMWSDVICAFSMYWKFSRISRKGVPSDHREVGSEWLRPPKGGLLAEPKNMPPLAIISGNYTQNTIFGTTNQSTIFVHKSQTCRMFVDLRTSLKQSTQNIPTNIHDIVVIMWIVQGQGVYMGIPYGIYPKNACLIQNMMIHQQLLFRVLEDEDIPKNFRRTSAMFFWTSKLCGPLPFPRTLRPQTKLYRTSKAPMTSWRLRKWRWLIHVDSARDSPSWTCGCVQK